MLSSNKRKPTTVNTSTSGPTQKGIAIDHLRFHPCVGMTEFDKTREITFVPPDGVFELVNYSITENINLPFKIIPIYSKIGDSRLEVSIKIKTLYDD